MSDPTRVNRPIYSLLPTDIAGFDSLAGLALDMRWSWNHATDFRKDVAGLVQASRDAAEAPAWFQQTYPQSPLSGGGGAVGMRSNPLATMMQTTQREPHVGRHSSAILVVRPPAQPRQVPE